MGRCSRVTPWRNQAEWASVKDCFYAGKDELDIDVDGRSRALARVSAWSVRGRVPHAVISTAMLTSAKLRDQARVLSVLESRMLLAMAITRFVNGLLDPAQQAVFAISMHALAKSLDLPECFVEIRHSATHDLLPALPVLRHAVDQALDWLWHRYWTAEPKLDNLLPKANEDTAAQAEHFNNILKRWRKLRKNDPKRLLRNGDNEPSTKLSLELIKELTASKRTTSTTALLSQAFLAQKNLLTRSVQAHDIWLPLLKVAFEHFPGLRMQIIMGGITILARDARSDELKLDLSLLGGQDASQDPPDSVQNTDGAFLRLQVWICKLIRTGSGTVSENKDILRALSIADDEYTLEIMKDLQGEPAFEKIGHMLSLRLPITVAPNTFDDSPRNELPDLNDIESPTTWQMTTHQEYRPIGFLHT